MSFLLSLPVRECGLKSGMAAGKIPGRGSLPVRECGLKSHLLRHLWYPHPVTPRAGVWIEILRRNGRLYDLI